MTTGTKTAERKALCLCGAVLVLLEIGEIQVCAACSRGYLVLVDGIKFLAADVRHTK